MESVLFLSMYESRLFCAVCVNASPPPFSGQFFEFQIFLVDPFVKLGVCGDGVIWGTPWGVAALHSISACPCLKALARPVRASGATGRCERWVKAVDLLGL